MRFIIQQGIRVVRRILFAALVITLLAPVMPAAIVHAAGNIQYVFAYLDSPGTLTDCRDVAAGCSLRDALHAAADGDTIQFAHSTSWPITYTLDLARGPLIVGHAVTIQGPGASNLLISGGGAVTVFTVNSAVTATISGLTIADGDAGNNVGGGINNSGTLTVAQSAIQNNSAPNGHGGGVYNAGTLTLTGCTVSGNSSGGGGGIGNGDFTATSLTITGSTITGNTATVGGGILTQFAGTVTITASTIQGNHATNGGGIANGFSINGNKATGSDVTITGSTVRDNQATGTGGGIYSNLSLTLTNSTVSGNNAGGNGGGLFNEPYNAANATLIATTVSNNTVSGSGSSGGGINDASGGTVTLTASLVAGNMTTGGATAPDLANTFMSSGHNLVGISMGSTGLVNGTNGDLVGAASAPLDPRLNPLAANGGPTATHALRLNSPAIDTGGPCPSGITQDQRGQPRIGACDIGAYEYQPVTPTVSNATGPASGGGVTFHGTGFQTGSQLTIGGTTITAPASGVSDDGTALTLTVPAHSTGNVGFAVTNPGGHVAAGTLTYVPVVTSLSATSGSNTGGSSVIITGIGFVAGNTSVMFGNTSATVTNVTATAISVTVPAHGVGTVDVTVTVSGVSATKAGAYTYGVVNPIAPPRPLSGSPVTGNPGSAPSPRPTGSPTSGSPNPLPPSR